jgi:hypothetical protein
MNDDDDDDDDVSGRPLIPIYPYEDIVRWSDQNLLKCHIETQA